MRLFKNLIVSLLTVVNAQAFASQMLSYPVAQPPECNQSYENAQEPKTTDQVLSALKQICLERGGRRVIHKEITSGNSTEPTDVILSCIGENPVDFTVFTCTYSSRNEGLRRSSN
jgi:hypothetical protein